MEPALPQKLFLMTDPTLLAKFNDPNGRLQKLLQEQQDRRRDPRGAVPGHADALADRAGPQELSPSIASSVSEPPRGASPTRCGR